MSGKLWHRAVLCQYSSRFCIKSNVECFRRRQVHRIDVDCHGDPQFEQYETELLDPLQSSEADRQFFKRLDAQLNKVNKFYRMKETQYIARAKRLEEQLLTLFQVQEEHAQQRRMFGPKVKDHNSDDSEEADDDDDEGDDIGVYQHLNTRLNPLLNYRFTCITFEIEILQKVVACCWLEISMFWYE